MNLLNRIARMPSNPLALMFLAGIDLWSAVICLVHAKWWDFVFCAMACAAALVFALAEPIASWISGSSPDIKFGGACYVSDTGEVGYFYQINDGPEIGPFPDRAAMEAAMHAHASAVPQYVSKKEQA